MALALAVHHRNRRLRRREQRCMARKRLDDVAVEELVNYRMNRDQIREITGQYAGGRAVPNDTKVKPTNCTLAFATKEPRSVDCLYMYLASSSIDSALIQETGFRH